MRTLATDSTADQLLDYLVSDGATAEWIYFNELGDWESLYNLRGERSFVGKLAHNLAGRGLVEIRRASLGMQVRLTLAGISLANERQGMVISDTIDWSYIADSFSC
jgi:hypothetical protein